jgi:hypothetical protein
MRDRWKSYDHYPCAHSICGAHLLRDCTYIQQQEPQEWAEQMHDLRLRMAAAAEEWRQRGAQAVPGYERDEWIAQYFDLLASGFAAQPAFSAEEVPKEQGRRKQSAAKNLLDDLALARRAGPGFPDSHFLFGGICGGLRSAPPSSSQARTMLEI